jgi:N-acetylmuramoyl-L-alanine amidase
MRAVSATFAALFLLLAACPGAEPASLRANGTDYLRLDDGAAQLGMRLVRLDPPSEILLKDGARPVARFSDRSREADIQGLRVFLGDPVIERGGYFYVSRVDYRTRLLPRIRPELGVPLPRVPRVIAIDPGHGGADHGSENRSLGIMEKTYTLDVALRVRRLLEAAGYSVVMTRDSDVKVDKQVRSEIANTSHADVLVSIHFNSLYPNTKTTGVEVLSFPPVGQRSTNSWSPGQSDDSENYESPVDAFGAWNNILAGVMHRHLLDGLHSADRGEKFEHLGVLRGLKCPGVLVEPAFISSDIEGPEFANPAFRDAVAASIVSGIQDYAALVRRYSPAGLAPLPQAAPSAQPQAGLQGAAPAPVRLQPTRPSP